MQCAYEFELAEAAVTGVRSWPFDLSPFHIGEQTIQKQLGVRERIEALGRHLIRNFMPDEHREFFSRLSFIILGTVDTEGQPLASIVTGSPGFLSSPDPETLRINAPVVAGNFPANNLREGGDIGALGIDFATRRRNRVNGVIFNSQDEGFSIAVTQSYGNCPQYIQSRDHETVRTPSLGSYAIVENNWLEPADRLLIETSDTFFIASAFGKSSSAPSHGVDASHRGGPPGFVCVDDKFTLTLPDYVGNFAFNTLGNLLLNPRCGLLFLDLETGTTLQIAARARIIWDDPKVQSFKNAQRLVRFHIVSVRRIERRVDGETSAAP